MGTDALARLASEAPQAAGHDEFHDKVDCALEQVQSDAGTGAFSVVIVELARFNVMLGSYGPAVLDELMVAVARRLADWLGPRDSMSRLVGGHFALLVFGSDDPRAAKRLGAKIERCFNKPFDVRGEAIMVDAITGHTTSARAYEDANAMLRDAAAACNKAGQNVGQGAVAFETHMRLDNIRQLTLLTDLRVALEKQQLTVAYQPVVRASDGTMVGFEALVRWRHPERGAVSPGEFIPLAEQSGLIAPLGEFVLESACGQVAAWNKACPDQEPLHVSVNLSPVQFRDESLAATVQQVLVEAGLAPQQLRLEVTESAVIDRVEQAREMLNRFRAAGIRFSLDDFGTGFSSFSCLTEMPYDVLKLDRSFVVRMAQDSRQASIVQSIIQMSHTLGMKVVAEGVEETKELDLLLAMGCDFIQGYLFARPMSPDEVQEHLEDRHFSA